jgi:F-type H+-transporting ATPase subunit b
MPTHLGVVFASGGAMVDLDGSLFIQVGVFFLLYFLLKRWVFNPMLALFAEREAAIDGAKREARALQVEAEAKLRDFEVEMQKVKLEMAAEREAIRQDAARLERALLDRAREEAQQMQREAAEQRAAEAAKIRREIENIAPVLAAEIVSKLLGRGVV